MRDSLIKHRNRISGGIYRMALKPFFFRRDPEEVHDRMTATGQSLGRTAFGRGLVSAAFGYKDERLRQAILGIGFENPVGLAAGFDKNAQLGEILPSVGFGFAELGSVTGEPCEGNPKPRLWRLPGSESIAVYYGLKNDGCEAIAARLAGKKSAIPLGMSVAMTNCLDNLDTANGVKDFAKAFRTMEPVASYITVNISCPNTEGGQPFVQADKLDRLFGELDRIPTQKPVFIKLSPDMTDEGLDALLDTVKKHRVHGIIVSNLTKRRDLASIKDGEAPAKGGLSGKVVQDQADRMLSHIYGREGKRFVLIGCGGVSSAEDAYKKIRLGASLVQLITGMIYEGPQLISEINRGLVELLERDGLPSISEAVGKGWPAGASQGMHG